MKNKKILILLLALLTIAGGCGKNNEKTSSENKSENVTSTEKAQENNQTNDKKLKVFASVYPVYDFTKKIGGDKIDLQMLATMGLGAHDWEPTIKDLAKLETADLLVLNGSGLEGWTKDIKDSIKSDKLTILETTAGMELLEGHAHDHDHGEEGHEHEDEHKEEEHKHEEEHKEEDHGHEHEHEMATDPHVWTSPKHAKKQLEIIAEKIIEKDPANKEYYQENLKKYQAEFDKLDKAYADTVSKLKNKDLVVSHEAFSYLAKDYGLNQVGIEGIIPESEPSPQRMAEIIEIVKDKKITTIFYEQEEATKVADTIAKATGTKVKRLHTLEALSQKELDQGLDYFAIMYNNLDAIKEGLN